MTTSKKEEYKYFSYTEMSNIFCTAQRDMALLLGVSQSQVAMHQSGERKLPKPAREMLRNLRDALNEAAKIEIGPEVLAQAKLKKDNEHLIWMAEERLAELKKKLATMEEKYNPAIITLYK
jgi:predicted transcriptional regulator